MPTDLHPAPTHAFHRNEAGELCCSVCGKEDIAVTQCGWCDLDYHKFCKAFGRWGNQFCSEDCHYKHTLRVNSGLSPEWARAEFLED